MRVCSPVLETDTIKYSVQPGTGFLDPGYFRATKGQQHTGADFNATTGGNTDLGNRVRACADGVVVAAKDYPVWGGIVLIHHPDLGVWTQYGHLINIAVKAGQTVKMGDILGGIGRGAGNRYYAHLHFEVRRSDLPADHWPSSRMGAAAAAAYIRQHYLDPEAWLKEQHALCTLAGVEAARSGNGVVKLVDGGGKEVVWNGADLYAGQNLRELVPQLRTLYPTAGGPWQYGDVLTVWVRRNGEMVLERLAP